jgi:hypothetical protein
MTVSNEKKQQQQRQPVPSKELVNLVIELKANIMKIKGLYKQIDKKALEEGFHDGEIYDIDDIIITTTTKSSSSTNNNYAH